jgi:hypothetical protein
MSDPPRLLETPDGTLATRLLRSATHDRPRPGALDRALSGATLLGTASIATKSVAAGLGKALAPWLLTGLMGGVVASVAVHAAIPFVAPNTSLGRKPGAGPAPQPNPTRAGELSVKGGEPDAVPSPQLVPERPQTPPSTGEVTPRGEQAFRVVTPARSAAGPGPKGDAVAPRAPAVGAFNIDPAAPHESDQFAAELVLIDAARRSLSAGSAVPALSALAKHAREFPGGHFRPEALVLEIEAQALRGDSGVVRRLASHFLAVYPGHPLGKRVRELATTP